ncbi:MAG: hypothetical protein MUE59_17175, partial [Thiobacillaceae bacterium]|nr:hypothetical protein [Thiobacillaceae bacterium]
MDLSASMRLTLVAGSPRVAARVACGRSLPDNAAAVPAAAPRVTIAISLGRGIGRRKIMAGKKALFVGINKFANYSQF